MESAAPAIIEMPSFRDRLAIVASNIATWATLLAPGRMLAKFTAIYLYYLSTLIELPCSYATSQISLIWFLDSAMIFESAELLYASGWIISMLIIENIEMLLSASSVRASFLKVVMLSSRLLLRTSMRWILKILLQMMSRMTWT